MKQKRLMKHMRRVWNFHDATEQNQVEIQQIK